MSCKCHHKETKTEAKHKNGSCTKTKAHKPATIESKNNTQHTQDKTKHKTQNKTRHNKTRQDKRGGAIGW